VGLRPIRRALPRFDGAQAQQQAIASGARAYLRKPVDSAKLLKVIGNALA